MLWSSWELNMRNRIWRNLNMFSENVQRRSIQFEWVRKTSVKRKRFQKKLYYGKDYFQTIYIDKHTK